MRSVIRRSGHALLAWISVCCWLGSAAYAMSEERCGKLAEDMASLQQSLKSPENLTQVIKETYEVSLNSMTNIYDTHCKASQSVTYQAPSVRHFGNPSGASEPMLDCDIQDNKCKAIHFIKFYYPEKIFSEHQVCDQLVNYILRQENRLSRNNKILRGIIEAHNKTSGFVVNVAAGAGPFALIKSVMKIGVASVKGYNEGADSALLRKLSIVGNSGTITNHLLYKCRGR